MIPINPVLLGLIEVQLCHSLQFIELVAPMLNTPEARKNAKPKTPKKTRCAVDLSLSAISAADSSRAKNKNAACLILFTM